MSGESTENKQAETKQDGQRFYHAQTGYQLILSLSKDEMECRAHLEVKADGKPPSEETVYGYLTADGIINGVDQQAIQELLATTRPGKSGNAVVANGILPVNGDDGQLVYTEVASENSAGQGGETADPSKEKIDFRSVQQFINVDPDQEIGRIIPPTRGTAGSTVRGKPVAAETGKPLILKIGKNVRAGGEHGNLLFSEIHGRVKLDAESIQVVEEYVVDGDVDFSVGNVRFNGFVEVRGDVLDGFQVSASKGLKITGNVGACRIVSHGNIEFCGMNGQGQGSILCGGSITANFIHDTEVECWGDMQINVELRTCKLQSRGSLMAGLISGGKYVTLGGIEVKKLGAASGLKTFLHCGINYNDLDRMNHLLEQLEELLDKLRRTRDLDTQTKLAAEKMKLMTAVVELRNRKPEGSNAKVNIKDKLFEGVTISLGSAVETISVAETGPMTLIENSTVGGLRRLPYSGLEHTASDLEAACKAQEEEERLERERLEQERLEQERLEQEQQELEQQVEEGETERSEGVA